MAAATPTGALVALHHVSFRFDDGITLFDSLDLAIDRTPTGIVGRNGVGKSLLAQLIAGRRTPSAGSIGRHANRRGNRRARRSRPARRARRHAGTCVERRPDGASR
ncbi:hypothetical protein PI86_00715 [Burkholderia sp. A9]|nr:hypothetical protein PI86_00715 [Burkholderia sp. A9]